MRATGCLFGGARLPYADLSKARLTRCTWPGADLSGANLHAIEEEQNEWSGANLKGARRTDNDRLEAETFKRG